MFRWIASLISRFRSRPVVPPVASVDTPSLPSGPPVRGTPLWYEDLFKRSKLRDEPAYVQRIAYSVQKAIRNAERYRAVETQLGVPWPLVAALHGLEGSFEFGTCLHNGDPLGKPTVRVPAGRGPFHKWEDAAVDALELHGCRQVGKWTVGEMLAFAERYNGLGYLKHRPEMVSPYVWAGTDLYLRGKYVRDGEFNPTVESKQIGVATMLKRLADLKIIELKFS